MKYKFNFLNLNRTYPMFGSLFFVLIGALFFINIPKSFANKIDVDVNGLVCEFCAVTIEKGFKEKSDIVSEVEVNLETKKVILNLKDNKNISDAEITDIITNNGYNVVKINRK